MQLPVLVANLNDAWMRQGIQLVLPDNSDNVVFLDKHLKVRLDLDQGKMHPVAHPASIPAGTNPPQTSLPLLDPATTSQPRAPARLWIVGRGMDKYLNLLDKAHHDKKDFRVRFEMGKLGKKKKQAFPEDHYPLRVS